ncbi:MAG: DUF3368 domain-containing protein [Prosthecobacter sp.]|uniref:DUF3368 domain-containing protein n=1 Tax=Prosthecobacter sp. TaxID=1965333 RepID=UPI003900979A
MPPAVAAELAQGAATLPAIQRLLDAAWLTVRTLNHSERAKELLEEVDAGEAEAIALYEELKADLLLVDELDARDLAEKLGIARIGLLGVLLNARKSGVLKEPLRPVFESLLQHGFRASRSFIEQLLKEAGE